MPAAAGLDRQRCSPRTRSGARLVARTCTAGHPARSADVNSPAAVMRWSSYRARAAVAAAQVRDAGLDEGLMESGGRSKRGGNGGRQQRRIAQCGKIDEDDTVGKLPATSWATARARRVFPTPPGPVSVRSGAASSSRAARAAAICPPAPQRGARQRQEMGMVTRQELAMAKGERSDECTMLIAYHCPTQC